MKASTESSDLVEFQKAHRQRQNYRANRQYREEYRPRLFKMAVLLLAVILSIFAATIMFARGGVAPESSFKPKNFALPPPVAVDNLVGQKLVALTFDDGPDPYTTETLLDILKSEKVTVTFFVLGSRVDRYGQIVQRAYREGHQIASHTTHHKDLTKLPPPVRQAEINSTVSSIERTIGVRPTVMRPPYGEWDAAVLHDAGMPLILWSIDTNDWKYRDAEKVYNHVMERVRDGSIILLHDVHATTVQAAARIVPALKAQGYAVVTVNRLMMTRGGSFAVGHYYRHFYP